MSRHVNLQVFSDVSEGLSDVIFTARRKKIVVLDPDDEGANFLNINSVFKSSQAPPGFVNLVRVRLTYFLYE